MGEPTQLAYGQRSSVEEKTSSVHFLRFELSESMALALKGGAALAIGCDHPRYAASVETSPGVRSSLVKDLA